MRGRGRSVHQRPEEKPPGGTRCLLGAEAVGVGVGAGVLSVDDVDPFVDTDSLTGATSVNKHKPWITRHV